MSTSLTPRSLFFFILLSLFSSTIPAQDNVDTISKGITECCAPYKGFGLNFGVTIFVPRQINNMIEDIYDDLKGNYAVYSQFGAPVMFMGESFKFKGVFYLNRHVALEPYGQAFWAAKYLTIINIERSAWVHLLFYSGGLNTWIRLNPDKLVSFKTGAGAFGATAIYWFLVMLEKSA
jgi:hypothetical protein